MDGVAVFFLKYPGYFTICPIGEKSSRTELEIWWRWGNSVNAAGEFKNPGLVYIPYYDLREGDADA